MAELPSLLPEQHTIDDPEYTDHFEEQLVITMEEAFMRNIHGDYDWATQDDANVATMGVSSGIPREELFDRYLCEVDYDWNVFDDVSVRATGEGCAHTPGQCDEVGVGDVGATCAPTRCQPNDDSTESASRSLKATKLSELKELNEQSTSNAHYVITDDLDVTDQKDLFGNTLQCVDYDCNVCDDADDNLAPTRGECDDMNVGAVSADCTPISGDREHTVVGAQSSLAEHNKASANAVCIPSASVGTTKHSRMGKLSHESTSDAHCFIAPKADLHIADDVKLFGSRQCLRFEDYEKEQKDLFDSNACIDGDWNGQNEPMIMPIKTEEVLCGNIVELQRQHQLHEHGSVADKDVLIQHAVKEMKVSEAPISL